MRKTLLERGIDPTPEVLSLFSRINLRHWEMLEEGRLTRQEVCVGRFRVFFEELGLDLDKLTRMLLDAFTTARVWTDDSLVCELNVRKQYPGMIPELTSAGVVVRVALMVDDTDTLPLEGGL